MFLEGFVLVEGRARKDFEDGSVKDLFKANNQSRAFTQGRFLN